MKYTLVLIAFLYANFLAGNTYKVGANQPYSTPNELYLANVIDHGDTIQIYGGTYSGNDALAHWNKNDLVILGMGDRPHLIADGAYILGKGIWVLSGDYITVSNIEFSGATVPDMNGAGIRLDGEGLTVRHCYFHHNENGILTGSPYAGYITIEYCEFAYNGFGDGFSHNLYVNHVERLEFRFNYTHHANIGHCLKSRANENYIIANRIMDEETGNSSRLIDLPNGGLAVIIGNELMQGPQAENNNMLGYGLEGLSNPTTHDCYIVNNTFVNKRTASCRFIQLASGTQTAWSYNNIFTGTGQVVDGILTEDIGNLIEPDINALLFEDELNYNYQLTVSSPAIDIGTTPPNAGSIVLDPFYEYWHPTTAAVRPESGLPDAGAHEYEAAMNGHEPELQKQVLYPNPTSDGVYISEVLIGYNFSLCNTKGNILTEGILDQPYFDLSQIPPGFYFFSFFKKHKTSSFKVLKQ